METKSDLASCVRSSSSRIKLENDDCLDLDEEEDSNEEDSDKDKDIKVDSKDVNGKPPYSYVAMIGKSWITIPIPILYCFVCSDHDRREPR